MKIEFSSQRREMLLLILDHQHGRSVTSPSNQQYKGSLFITSKNILNISLLCSQNFIKMSCVRQQNNVNVYLLAIKLKLHHVLALIIPQ